MANYVSSTMATGPKLKETLGKIDNYSPDSYSWTEISSSVTVNLTNPTATSGITSPGDYVIYKFTNGPSGIPTTLSPILLSLRSSGIYVSAKDAVYSYTSSTWKDVSEIVEDTTILYIKSDTAPSRTSNTFWFDTSKYASKGYVDLKYYDTTSKAWISIFNDTNYLKKSSIDPNNKATDIFKYITDKVTATTGQYATFLKHKNNELTYVHVTADERNRYAKIITQSELDTLLENTYKSQIQSSVDTAISNNLDVTQITSDTSTLQTSFNSHKTGHVTAANITAWNNKADANHTHAYTDGTVTINGSQVVAGVFTDSQLPNEMKERYYKITAASVAAEFGNTSLTDTDRAGKYHNGNAFYFESTSNGTTSRTWYRIIDQTKIGTSSWASGVTDFTAKVLEMSWANITGKPTTFSEYGITNDLYTKTQVDNKISAVNSSITEAENKLASLTENVSYDYTVDKEHPNFTPTWSTGALPESTTHEWKSICAGGNNDCVIVGTGSSAIHYDLNTNEQRVVDLPFYAEWISVCYGNGKYIAVANHSSKVAYSIDGESWFAADIAGDRCWKSVCFGDARFVAIADADYNGTDYSGPSQYGAYSFDGISWTQFTMPASAYWISVCYGKDKFVAVAYSSSSAAYSTDGVTWTSASLTETSFWASVCYGNNMFVAIGTDPCDISAYSTDGVTWSTASFTSGQYKSVCYGDNVFYTQGNNTGLVSIDGKSWISVPSDIEEAYSICYASGHFVLISSTTINYGNLFPNGFSLSYKSDALSSYGYSFYALGYANGIYVGIGSGYAYYSTDGINWTVRNTYISNSEKSSICYGDGKFVAIFKTSSYDDNDDKYYVSKIGYSTDGINWTELSTTFNYNFKSVCYGDGKFVVVGCGEYEYDSTTTAYYSTDGITWTSCTIESGHWAAVCYGAGKFVAVGEMLIIAYSTDGINWTRTYSLSSSAETLSSICYGAGKFVAVSYNNYVYSTDGINWTKSSLPTSSCDSICYGNGMFMITSNGSYSYYQIYFSYADSFSWISMGSKGVKNDIICYGNGRFVISNVGSRYIYYTTVNSFNISYAIEDYTNDIIWDSVCYGNSKYVAIGYTDTGTSYVAYSSDGDTWTTSNLTTSVIWRSVCYGNGKFVAVGHDSSNITYTAYSSNGSSWTSSSISSISAKWISVCYGNSKYVAVAEGSNLALYSTNGTSWSSKTLPATANWKCACYGDGTFVAIASDTNKAAYSTNGTSWTASTLPISADWKSVCYGNGKFVANSENDNNIIYSIDGKTWSASGDIKDSVMLSSLPESGYWRSICYGNGKFVAIASNAKVAYSSNGTNWTMSEIPLSGITGAIWKWNSVCYGNGTFVAVGSLRESYNTLVINTYVAYSTDGINWTVSNVVTDLTSQYAESICYGNGTFVIPLYNSNIVFYSTDGITWTQSTLPETTNWESICYGNGKFVAIATGTTVIACSNNGADWVQSNICANDSWQSICYGNGKFVAIAYYSTTAAYSTDGSEWIPSTLPDTEYWKSVCYGNGTFIAVAEGSKNAAYSLDGITWFQSSHLPFSDNWFSICYGEGVFVTVAYNSLCAAYTADGYNWYTKYQLPDIQLSRICYGDGVFVLTGKNSNILFYSTNCITWNSTNLPDKRFWSAICYNDSSSKFVLLGNYLTNALKLQLGYSNFFNIDRIGLQMNTGSITEYSDMMTGVTPNIDVIIKTTDGKIYKTTKNDNSSYEKPDGTIVTTTNSKEPVGASMLEFYVPASDTETSTATALSDDDDEVYGMDLVYLESNGTFVATTANGPYHSTDGRIWNASSNCTSEFSCICTGNNKFVGIVKNSNIAYYSTDGINWTAVTISETSYLWSSICYGNGMFVAVTTNFTNETVLVGYSTDAINWTVVSFNDSIEKVYCSIVYCAAISKFVAITEGSTNTQYQIQIATSSDAVSWEINSVNTTIGYYEKLFIINNTLYIIGKNGVLTSSDGISWTSGGLNWKKNDDKVRYGSNPVTYYKKSGIDQYFCTRMLYRDGNTFLTIFRNPNGGFILAKSYNMTDWESAYLFGANVTPKDMLYINDNLIIVGDSRI